MLESLDKYYGLEYQGLLDTCLDAQVEQKSDDFEIHQTKYF